MSMQNNRLLPSDSPSQALGYSVGIPGRPGTAAPGLGAESSVDEVTVRDLWFVLVRNRWLILTCVAAGLSVAAYRAATAVPVYQASTSIRIDEREARLPALEFLNEGSAGSEISTEMEVLRSRSLAQVVVDSLRLQVRVTTPVAARRDSLLTVLAVHDSSYAGEFILERSGDGFRINSEGRVVRPSDRIRLGPAEVVLKDAALRQSRIVIAIQPLRNAVGVVTSQVSVNRPSRDANVVVVRYRATDPDLAREVPNVIADRFIALRNHVKKTETRSTIEFLHAQIDMLARQLAAAEDSLRAYRQTAGVVSLTDEASTQVQRLAVLQAERATLDAERSALGSLLSEVRRATVQPDEPSPYRRLLAFPTLLRNQALAQQLAALNTIENERAELLIRRTPRDPDVIALSDRIRDMEAQIHSLAATYLQGLSNQVASTDAELQRFHRRLQEVPHREVEYARLARQPKILEELYVNLQARLKEAEIAEAVQDPSVRVVDRAITPDRPVEPNKAAMLLMGGVLGVMAGIGGAFLRKSFDSKVRSRDDVLRITGVQVLGIIPRIESAVERKQLLGGSFLKRLALTTGSGAGGNGKLVRAADAAEPAFASRLITGNDPRSPISEAYRSLRTNITFARLDAPPKTLVFTSAMPGDGKSTTSSNLAITLAQQGLKVLLVDADLRRGVLNDVFHLTRDPGLSNLIMGIVEPAAAIRTVPLGDNLTIDFLPTGSLPPNPAELVGSQRMRDLLAKLEEVYDAIILDAPPLNVVTDAALLGTKADGVLVVTRAGKNTVHELEYAMMQLANVRAPVLGMILNDVDIKGAARYGYGGYGAYQYYYSETA